MYLTCFCAHTGWYKTRSSSPWQGENSWSGTSRWSTKWKGNNVINSFTAQTLYNLGMYKLFLICLKQLYLDIVEREQVHCQWYPVISWCFSAFPLRPSYQQRQKLIWLTCCQRQGYQLLRPPASYLQNGSHRWAIDMECPDTPTESSTETTTCRNEIRMFSTLFFFLTLMSEC